MTGIVAFGMPHVLTLSVADITCYAFHLIGRARQNRPPQSGVTHQRRIETKMPLAHLRGGRAPLPADSVRRRQSPRR